MTFELTDDELTLAYHAVGVMLQESPCSTEDDEEVLEFERKLSVEVERRERVANWVTVQVLTCGCIRAPIYGVL